MISFWKRAQQLPPILVRLLARHPHGKPLTTEEIAQRSGLSAPLVETLSHSTSWTGIDMPTASAFLSACNADFCNREQMKRIDAYRRSKPTWKYLRTSPLWKTYYEPLMKKWLPYASNRN